MTAIKLDTSVFRLTLSDDARAMIATTKDYQTRVYGLTTIISMRGPNQGVSG